MELKKVLKELLHKKDLSVAQLARATGVARQTIDNWIAGQEPRSLTQVKKLPTTSEFLSIICVLDKQKKKQFANLKTK